MFSGLLLSCSQITFLQVWLALFLVGTIFVRCWCDLRSLFKFYWSWDRLHLFVTFNRGRWQSSDGEMITVIFEQYPRKSSLSWATVLPGFTASTNIRYKSIVLNFLDFVKLPKCLWFAPIYFLLNCCLSQRNLLYSIVLNIHMVLSRNVMGLL